MSCENLTIPKPQTGQCVTTLFGIPYGAAGRTVASTTYPIDAIVLHCYDGTIAELCNEMKCRVRSSVISGSTENSFHYGIGGPNGSGPILQFVEDNNISWTFGTYKNNTYVSVPPPNIAINWPVLQAEHGINTTPDVYTIDIALAMGSITPATDPTGCYECPTASGLDQNQHDMLVQLLAFLAREYSIPIDTDHIQFHDLIHCGEGVECACKDIADLLIEVAAYCPPCEKEATTAPVAENNDEIQYIYGITEPCCDDSPGCLNLVPWNGCFLGDLAVDGTLDNYILGLTQDPQTMQWCLTRGCLAVENPLTGCGTTDDPLRLDRCLFGDWLPDEVIGNAVNFVAVDAAGCLIEVPATDVLQGTETPITVVDTNCIDLTVSGAVDHTLQADIILSECVGNLITCEADGLCAQFECADLAGLFAAGTIANLYGDDGAGACVTQDVQTLVNNAICNIATDMAAEPTWLLGQTAGECPVFVTPDAIVAAGLVVNDTDCIDLTLVGNILTAAPIIDPAGDNILTCGVNGLYVPDPGFPALTMIDSNCVDLTYTQVTGELQADIIVDPAVGNQVSCGVDGLYVPPLAGLLVDDTDCIDLNLTGETLTANPIISGPIAGFPNALFCTPTGLYIAVGAGIVPQSTNCISLDISAPGVLTATIVVDPAGDNQLSCGVNGLYVPEMAVLDTDCVDLTFAAGVLSAELILAPTQGAIQNGIQCIPGQGLYTPLYPDLTVVDDDCIDFTYTQSTGTLTAQLVLDPDPDNQLTCGPNGLLMATPAGITVDDTDCLNLNLTAGGVLSGDIPLAGPQGGVPNIISCLPGQGLYVPQGASITVTDSNCIDLDISISNVLSADLLVSGAVGGFNNITSCEAGGVFTPETELQITGPSPIGGNIIGIDTNGDGVVDFEWCEGFCDIASADDCEAGVLYGDGGVGEGYMLREISLTGTTLTINSAPDHVSESEITPTATTNFEPAPTGAPGTLVAGTSTTAIYTNVTCRNMVVDITYPGYGADIAVTALTSAATTFSYAIQYEVFINGGAVSIINPDGTDYIFTKNAASMNASETVENDGSTVGFTHSVTLPPGDVLTVELVPRVRIGLTPINVDLANSRVQIDEARLLISARTTF